MPDYTILLVDYEPRSIRSLLETLQGAGHRVEVAQDGVKGLEAFTRLQPNLVLAEAMLPKKNGFELCKEIKATPAGASTPVAIVTAVYKGRKYRSQATHFYGADAFIEKPVSPEELLGALEPLLRQSAGAAAATPAPAERSVPLAAPEAAKPAALPVAAPATAAPQSVPVAAPETPAPKPAPSASSTTPADATEAEIEERLDALFS